MEVRVQTLPVVLLTFKGREVANMMETRKVCR